MGEREINDEREDESQDEWDPWLSLHDERIEKSYFSLPGSTVYVLCSAEREEKINRISDGCGKGNLLHSM